MTQQAKKNIDLLRRLFDEMFAKGDMSNYAEFADSNIRVHCPSSWRQLHADELQGISSSKEIDAAYLKAFRFKNAVIQDAFANNDQGEKIVVRWSCEGKHVADFFEVKATQQSFALTGVTIYHFNPAGKIAEVWQSWDMLGLLQQIGALSIRTL